MPYQNSLRGLLINKLQNNMTLQLQSGERRSLCVNLSVAKTVKTVQPCPTKVQLITMLVLVEYRCKLCAHSAPPRHPMKSQPSRPCMYFKEEPVARKQTATGCSQCGVKTFFQNFFPCFLPWDVRGQNGRHMRTSEGGLEVYNATCGIQSSTSQVSYTQMKV